jgi:molybdopterin synthase catalytic subunit
VRVKVLFFGQLKDIVGRSQESVEAPDGASLSTIFDRYADAFPRIREMAGSIVLARNHEFSPPSSTLADGDEVALLPPVSGGAWLCEVEKDGHFFALTRDPIDSRALARRLLSGEDGAVVDFEGVVRNNTKGRRTRFLEYECYEPLALKKMAQIGNELAAEFAVGRIAMVHRLGKLEIGEASVAVVVTAPHRKPAFEAALEGINRLKRLVPVWKKEFFEDGEVWVEGEWDKRAPVAGS